MSKSDFHILVVDDDLEYAQTCARTIERVGYSVQAKDSPASVLEEIALDEEVALVLTDLQMPHMDGISLLEAIKSQRSVIEVVIMTGYGSIESAVKAVKAGACEYITKPFDKDELLNAVQKVFKVWELQQEVSRLKQLVSDKLQIDGFIFKNKAMSTVYQRISAAARCHCSVFITGESGTGKELVARAIHQNSPRVGGPFVPVNCSAITDSLIEAELFGYRKGAFTGANDDRAGLFAAADQGTLFLDEIVEMAIGTQSKLLRSIQERRIRPVGAVDEIPLNVRFIAATNRRVEGVLKEKKFREDLYHRLNVIQINMPALRDMPDEIPDLLQNLLASKSKEHQRGDCEFDMAALAELQGYSWPGNIREATNIVERCLVNTESGIIGTQDLPVEITTPRKQFHSIDTIPTFDQAERDLVVRALRESNGNKSQAAELLGISRPRLYKKIEQYDIDESSL
jgi:DNA-binding NtrC family response regulator